MEKELRKKSVRKSGTLGIMECVVRSIKTLQHIYFLELYPWGEPWCLSGVLSYNKPQNEREQYTISYQQTPTIQALQGFTERYETPFDGLKKKILILWMLKVK